MSARHRRYCWIVVAGLLSVAGCKPKPTPAAASPGAARPPDSAATVAAMTRGMRQILPTSLSRSHIGVSCAVVARASEEGTHMAPPPPPLGMIYLMGTTTLYKGEIRDVSADRLEIQAPYPTSGHMKVISIQRADIQAIYLAR